ncbi:MAG: DUF1501 domain-containing protein [Bacteroidetes bacterium]|nr:DUF1501 domain-containing protein [Bacteroidota bacterium]
MKSIDRRKFFKYSALASASIFIPDFLKLLQAKEINGNSFPLSEAAGGKKLVIIQLSGGNDGLNTVVPYNNDIYYELRPGISIERSKVLRLSENAGLNPEMNKLKELFDKGNLSVISNVGYPNPDRSHFRSMDIWQSGSGSDEYLETGWIGRYLDSECDGCSNPYNAIEVDPSLNLALKGKYKNGIALEDPKRFYMNTSERYFLELSSESENFHEDNNVGYLYKTLAETTSSADYIYENSKIYKSKRDYPETQFGKNLKTIAEMIISDTDTTVYYVSLTGFDTHVNQKSRQDRLLRELSEGMNSITEDLRENGKLDETLIMTFSEFGRRVKQNASGGTDHGTANNIFIINGNLKKPGLYNELADLKDLDSGDLKYEIDFRSVYSTIMRKWLNADETRIFGKSFEYLNFI